MTDAAPIEVSDSSAPPSPSPLASPSPPSPAAAEPPARPFKRMRLVSNKESIFSRSRLQSPPSASASPLQFAGTPTNSAAIRTRTEAVAGGGGVGGGAQVLDVKQVNSPPISLDPSSNDAENEAGSASGSDDVVLIAENVAQKPPLPAIQPPTTPPRQPVVKAAQQQPATDIAHNQRDLRANDELHRGGKEEERKVPMEIESVRPTEESVVPAVPLQNATPTTKPAVTPRDTSPMRSASPAERPAVTDEAGDGVARTEGIPPPNSDLSPPDGTPADGDSSPNDATPMADITPMESTQEQADEVQSSETSPEAHPGNAAAGPGAVSGADREEKEKEEEVEEEEEEEEEDNDDMPMDLVAMRKYEYDQLAKLNPAQLRRYEQYRRSDLKNAKVKKVLISINPVLAKSHDLYFVAVKGLAKLFVGDMVEMALQIRKHYGDKGALAPKHIREAYRILRRDGKIPTTGDRNLLM